ncbi:ATP-binding protein [Mahella sp.]|uniref:sensor histidine kinase n=1 Tax=Mahella sp. TaxID=2798721 RepID=UPI0025C468D0|nr:ATP-binding protein [Mahella sp.]
MNQQVNASIVDNMRLLWTAIQKSWQRGVKKELHPHELKGTRVLSAKEITAIKKEKVRFLDFISIYLDYIEFLFMSKPYSIIFCDEYGITLNHRAYGIDISVQEGMIWGEDYIGVNAIGTCLKEEMPTMVIGEEHDWEVMKDKASFAVPLLDIDRNIIGALAIILMLNDGDPAIMALMIMMADMITRHWADDKELLLLRNRLAASERAEDNVQSNASVLSHEVRNSISTLGAYIQLLQLDKLVDDERANKMLEEMARVNRMMQDFRRLTKYIKFKFSDFNINDVLNKVVEFMLPKVQLKGIEVITELDGQEIYINGDMDAIEQVFLNLLENSIQAIEGDVGHIWIKSLRHNDSVKIIIRDDGCGISDENKENLFKPFFTTKASGSGIGLAFCKDVLKAHGGDITAESREGEYTSFTITLPLGDCI